MVELDATSLEVPSLTVELTNDTVDRGAVLAALESYVSVFGRAYASLHEAYRRAASAGAQDASVGMLSRIDAVAAPLLTALRLPVAAQPRGEWQADLTEATEEFVGWMERLLAACDWVACREASMRLPRLYFRHCAELGFAFVEPRFEATTGAASERGAAAEETVGWVAPTEVSIEARGPLAVLSEGVLVGGRRPGSPVPASLPAA